MAGTATEQFVGLGKPAISFAGQGPQYNLYFANKQKRLLGKSLTLIDNPEQFGEQAIRLLKNQDQLQDIFNNGKERLGMAGASARIAHLIQKNSN